LNVGRVEVKQKSCEATYKCAFENDRKKFIFLIKTIWNINLMESVNKKIMRVILGSDDYFFLREVCFFLKNKILIVGLFFCLLSLSMKYLNGFFLAALLPQPQ